MPNDTPTNFDSWLAPHFRQLLDDGKRLQTLMRLSINGITAITEMPLIGEQIIRLEQERGIYKDAGSLTFARAEAELARLEVEQGFPITLTQHLVDIWGILEASVRNLAALWLEHMGAMRMDSVQKLKVRIGDFDPLEGHAKYQFVVKLLEREEASSIKNGADRFESLLACVGLDGPIPKDLRKALFELSQLRNCIVHNARRADAQLTRNCPWLSLSIGQTISPTEEQVGRLFRAFWAYSMLILARASEAAGESRKELAEEVFADWRDAEPRA